MMYLVEGRNPKETRGQYVLTKEAAYAILEEMKQDFLKVNIYEKVDGEYKRIEKWERVLTNYDWLNSLPIEEQARFFSHEMRCEFCPNQEQCDLGANCKVLWGLWLKQPI